MRIVYDHQIFAIQDIGGISRCFVELYKEMPETIDVQISLLESDNVYIKGMGLPGIRPKRDGINHFICRKNFPGKWQLYTWYHNLFKNNKHPDFNLLNTINELEKGEFDIFHPTFFSDYFLPYLKGKPFVLTIHDMTPELYPQYFKRDDIQILMKRKLAPLADAIIAVSENTKQDIMRILDIPENKIHVIYHGCSMSSSIQCYSKFDFPYLLYVGDRKGYKNFIPFVKQIAPILKQNKEIHVICTGQPFNKEEIKLFKELRISNLFVNTWAETDADLYSLYHNAICFIYPSDYEGFGIPILEAYKANCPVLLNHASCFPEIAKDAAIYFNIASKNSLSDSLEKILSMNKKEKEDLLCIQRARLEDFSWKKSAKKLALVYESIKK